MPKYFLLLLLLFPLLEVIGFILVSQIIGIWPTIILIVFSSVFGAWLAKREGLQAIRLAQMQINQGQMPNQVMLDGLCILFGGLALLIPGFITDILGLLLLIPKTRAVFKALLIKWFSKLVRNGQFVVINRRPF
ncbi:exlusion protein FxsA [Alkalihalobacillus alcalophilus ATCC 27647 = CGMCC 1.3604]|uniref:Exlusion protein FxsA n=1 Tax=Alkalihalobacillus alcalophilus ATCC 27647 = CGMCC 1.3604 TaxID=1218173 RepID=A0A094WJ96_ALKAL|nr:FxsA family protein [Alkalihalobacillus alcalophilus]KGA97854.1 exlusion protein FxsA [Alkalihalobacillus alcalophilus ATCC 27647 = CGMCC 1.3604]MED1563867.1 membrane protein FxsA [Alkalihalobacillus alcalophilus]THG91087.1 exlusion protein FxsA [Alkalihalobacillus alcalophilus ATCC 27647 = CGMCC 1.3604]